MTIPVDVQSTSSTYTPPTGPNVRNNIDVSLPFEIPPYNTVEYFDKNGNIVGHYDFVNHAGVKMSDISSLPPDGAPYTAVLTVHTPSAGSADNDYA